MDDICDKTPQFHHLQQTSVADAVPGAGAFAVVTTVAATTIAVPSCDAAANATGADTIGWLQCGDFVNESRLSLHVTIEVRDSAGATSLAHREQYLTLRLFAAPPYSAIVGRKDGAASDPAAAAHEGDTGGDTHSGATLIHRRFACTDGAGSCAGAAPPDPDAALRAGVRWTNGNAPEP